MKNLSNCHNIFIKYSLASSWKYLVQPSVDKLFSYSTKINVLREMCFVRLEPLMAMAMAFATRSKAEGMPNDLNASIRRRSQQLGVLNNLANFTYSHNVSNKVSHKYDIFVVSFRLSL